ERSVHEYRQAESSVYKLDRTGTPVCWYLGNELFRAGDTTESMKMLERARELNPYHARLLNDLGSVYEKRGYYISAKETYERALALVPGMVETRLNLAAAEYNHANLSEAFSALKEIRNEKLLKGKERKMFDEFSLVIARQVALNDSTAETEGQSRNRFLEKTWTDAEVNTCFSSSSDVAGFLSCMHHQ
ncbi:MAG: tetratricopeptide repeat protein, partial [Bacteroidota bacterium]